MDSRGRPLGGSWETGCSDSGTRETVTRDVEGGICETGTQETRGDSGLGRHAWASEGETLGARTRDVGPLRGRLRRRRFVYLFEAGTIERVNIEIHFILVYHYCSQTVDKEYYNQRYDIYFFPNLTAKYICFLINRYISTFLGINTVLFIFIYYREIIFFLYVALDVP